MFAVNEYFDGKVKSLAFDTADGPATLGVMAPGTYEFGTTSPEEMTVVTGALLVQQPGGDEWVRVEAGHSFQVKADVRFGVRVEETTSYLCRYG